MDAITFCCRAWPFGCECFIGEGSECVCERSPWVHAIGDGGQSCRRIEFRETYSDDHQTVCKHASQFAWYRYFVRQSTKSSISFTTTRTSSPTRSIFSRLRRQVTTINTLLHSTIILPTYFRTIVFTMDHYSREWKSIYESLWIANLSCILPEPSHRSSQNIYTPYLLTSYFLGLPTPRYVPPAGELLYICCPPSPEYPCACGVYGPGLAIGVKLCPPLPYPPVLP